MKSLLLILTIALTTGTATAADTLRIVGSNTFGEKLGPLLVSAFEKDHPGIKIQLASTGSGDGLSALLEGRADIAPSSRPADADELRLARASDLRLRGEAIGSYGVVVIANGKNPVQSLSLAEIRDIFTGNTTNWKQVGGPDARIRLCILDQNTGARRGFQELAMRYEPYARGAREFRTKEDIAAAVAGDPHAIGYADMGPLPDGAKALLVNGIPANRTSINQGVYPFARTLFLYTVHGRVSPAARDFIRFVQSRDGQRIVGQAGFAPRIGMRLDRDGLAF